MVPGGHRGILAPKSNFDKKVKFGRASWVRLGGQDEGRNFTFMLKKNLRRPPGGSGLGFQRVLKTLCNIEASRDRFLVDLGRIWGAAREAKIVFSLQRE